jgi:hypothetical protein
MKSGALVLSASMKSDSSGGWIHRIVRNKIDGQGIASEEWVKAAGPSQTSLCRRVVRKTRFYPGWNICRKTWRLNDG